MNVIHYKCKRGYQLWPTNYGQLWQPNDQQDSSGECEAHLSMQVPKFIYLSQEINMCNYLGSVPIVCWKYEVGFIDIYLVLFSLKCNRER